MAGFGGNASESGHQEARPTSGVDSGTDSDAVSPLGDPISPGDPEMRDIPEGQPAARAFWAYERAKSRWRKYASHEPMRRVCQAIKRKGKGKGKGKNKGRTYLDHLADDDVQSTFAYFGKGKSRGKGKRRASGMGLGRKSNPISPGGNPLTCHERGPTEHFVGNCPRRRRAGRQMFVGTYAPTVTSASPSSTPLTFLAASGPPEPEQQTPLRVSPVIAMPTSSSAPRNPRSVTSETAVLGRRPRCPGAPPLAPTPRTSVSARRRS